MNLLALDLGTKCGWAIDVDLMKYPNSGVWNLTPSTHESSGERYRKFQKELSDLCYRCPFSFVVYEEVHAHIGVEAAHVYGGLAAILQTFCLENDIEYKGVPVQTIKKHATGSGNAKKDDMIFSASMKFPKINIIDDNHADALHLLDYAQKVIFSSPHRQNEPG